MANANDPTSHHATIPAVHLNHPNLALHVSPDKTIKLIENAVPALGKGEVLLHVKVTGICGSDMHLWHDGRIGPLVVESEYVLGHEAAGVVLVCGEGVNDLKPGDRVAIEPGVPCERCFLCRDGRYNLCEDVHFSGVWPAEGTCQRYKVHPAKWLHKIPPTMSFANAALLEPLSVALHALETAHVSLGRPALICGAGPIGLITLACARASGAWPLAITDVDHRRLEFAKTVAPGVRTYLVQMDQSAEVNARMIRRLFKPEWKEGEVVSGERIKEEMEVCSEYDAPWTVLECTGVESSVVTACFAVRRGGTVLVIGVGKAVMNNIPFMHISLAEIKLLFINRYHDTWPAGINLISSGLMNLEKLVTHTYSLEQAVQAFETCADPDRASIKIHIVDEVEARVLDHEYAREH